MEFGEGIKNLIRDETILVAILLIWVFEYYGKEEWNFPVDILQSNI